MALMGIRRFGDPVLRERAGEVATFDEALARLADDMLETMRAASGVGLAANQVGVLKRLFTWDGGEGEHGAAVNPVILETSEEVQEGDEGCLSFPGLFYPNTRPLRARIRAADVHGEERELIGEGLLARVFLHEIDHLNGILFIDHLARHDRKDAMRRIRSGELERPGAPGAHAGEPAL
ncbi:MAG TPA: peptide deformylase [Egibacteraceae bacterium]|nr:peptide deformylase [Egibacteraceae bacterium]